jgi:hypothetical protein
MGALTGYRVADWCTGRPSPHFFQSYSAQGPLYFIFIKEGPDAGKYQFHFETSQFHHSGNSRIPDLRAWLIRNPEIRQTFEAKAAEHGKFEFLSPEVVAQYRQQYIQSGEIRQLLANDKVTVLYLPEMHKQLQPYITGGTGNLSYSRRFNNADKVAGRFGNGVMYITLANHAVFTYKLGYTTCYHNDERPYPIKTLMNKIPELKELLTGLLRDGGVDTEDKTDAAVQQLVASGDAKQIFSTDALTVWWMSSTNTFQRYFAMQGPALRRLYTSPPLIDGSGIMILDVGTALVSYRLGDKETIDLNPDEMTDPNRSYYSIAATPINKFMIDHPATVPIIKKYADHYGYYPLMSDKGKAKHMEAMVERGVISVVKKDSPSILQLLTGDSAEMIRPLITTSSSAGSSSIKQLIESEIKRGPIYLIQGTILFVTSIGGTYQINSNNGQATMSTKHVLERFPALPDILKDQMAAAGVSAKPDTPLEDIVTALVRTGAIVPISPNPLVFKLPTLVGTRWFVEHHNGGKQPTGDIQWGPNGIITPYIKPYTSEGLSNNADAKIDPSSHVFGFLAKGNVPLILSIKRPVGGTKYSLNLFKDFSGTGSLKSDISSSQGVVAFMQKYPEVLKVLAPHLRDLEGAPQELLTTTAGDDADPHAKAAVAVTGIMKSVKAYGGAGKAQSLSEINADKFMKNAYTAAAYLREYAGQFTTEQAESMADRIVNSMKFVSRDSLRPMPVELAGWLSYAPQLPAAAIQRIVLKHPVFIAGVRPAPYDLVRQICRRGITDEVELVRFFANMDPDDEERLDRELFRDDLPVGVNFEHVRDMVEDMVARHGLRNATENKLIYLRNVPPRYIDGYLMQSRSSNIVKYMFPPDDAVLRAAQASNHVLTSSSGIPFYRKSPKIREASKYVRQHGTLTGFTYTPPGRVVLPAVPGAARPAPERQRAAPAPRAAREAPAPRPEQGAPRPIAAGFATRADHARHIIANRGPDDTRPVLIRRLIDEVGLTPAGAATYYYNLTRAAVREGEEDFDLFMSTLRLFE